MRVLLCGYHEAGYRVLRTLIERRCEVMVATHAAPSEIPNVAALAASNALETTVASGGPLLLATRRFRPDVIFSVYYRAIIPNEILTLAPRGAYNFHPSLLPRHRGCFSAPWALIEGDAETGVTCHVMTESVDAGDIVDRIVVPIDDADTGMSLYYKLVDVTVTLFPRVLEAVERNRLQYVPQTGVPTNHARRVPFDGVIDSQWPRDRIERFIRAMWFPPFPPAAVNVDGQSHPVHSIDDYNRIMRATPGRASECTSAAQEQFDTPGRVTISAD